MSTPNREMAPAANRDHLNTTPSLHTGSDDDSTAGMDRDLETTLDEFWQSRHHLGVIRQFAYARMCSPWAVLGVVLCRVLTQIPPWVTTPPLIGGRGSLNALVALVAPSGSGKGAAEAAAAELLPADELFVAPAGSGEGLAHQYAHLEKRDLVRDRNAVMFSIPEIDTLAGIGGRTGSTIMSKLRNAFSGEEIGFSYADPTKRLLLGAHGYRLTLIVGVQPDRGAPLLDDASGGTPQRFLWLPATDPHVSADPPAAPPAIHWRAPALREARTVNVPDNVARTIREAHAARSRGEGDALDGHALFVRLKIACALGFLDERIDMSEDDWHLAGTLMHMSDRTRQSVVTRLATQAQKQNEARGMADARREIVVDEFKEQRRVQRIGRRIVANLQTHGPETYAAARRRIRHSDRGLFDDALALQLRAGTVAKDGELLAYALAEAA